MRNYFGAMALAVALVLGLGNASIAARLIAQVDISSQTMTVTKDGRVLHRWNVSTGREGFRTPAGKWGVKRMHTMWYSRKYDYAPMPYSIFYHGGYAIHGTNAVGRLGRPASHGCVRLHTANAKRLYDLTRLVGARNMRVVVNP